MIIPFLILFLFNHPTTEDFYYEEMVNVSGFWDAQRFFYKFWGGRYLYYAMISTNPLVIKSIFLYNLYALIVMLLFFITFYYFISEFIRNSITKAEKILLTISILFLFCHSMPSTAQGFYWLGAALNYSIPMMLMMIFFISYHRQSFNGNRTLMRSAYLIFLSIAIAGFNEITGVIFFILIAGLMIRDYILYKKIDNVLIAIFLFLIICFYVSFNAPGNNLRGSRYLQDQNFVFSLENSFIFLYRHLLSWTFFSPIIPVTVLMFPVLFKLINSKVTDSKIYSVSPVYCLIFFSIFLYTGTFIMFWSTGIEPYDRVLNPLYFIFLLGWFYGVVLFFRRIKGRFDITKAAIPKFVYAAALALLLMFMVIDNNIRTAYSDLFSGNAKSYSESLNTRYETLRKSDCDSCVITREIIAPESFFFHDLNDKPKSMYNEGYGLFFQKKSIVLKK